MVRTHISAFMADDMAGDFDSKSCFAPVIGAKPRLLVLGSLPGDVSLAQRQYYAHPTNQFWHLIGSVIGQDLAALPYAARLNALMARGIGLWDVIKTAQRLGSLDSQIRGHETNPLAALVAELPTLRAIAFNGATSAKIGRQQLAVTTDMGQMRDLITLPSSSAAYCTINLEAKRARWRMLSTYLLL